MIDISMLNISPKLIDVEKNRVGTSGGRDYVKLDKKDITKSTEIYGNGKGMNESNYMMIDVGGRFPTQLFTNIKNDRYKYVKNIT